MASARPARRTTAPDRPSSLRSVIGLFVAGIVALLPIVIGLYRGKYVFKFHPAILLGACAGALTCTAALGARQEASQSTVPTIGYTVPCAVGRIVLAICGVVALLLLK